MTTPYATMPFDPTAVMGKRVVAALIDVAIAIVLFITLFANSAETSSVADLRFTGTAEEFCNSFNDTSTNAFCMPSNNDIIVFENSALLWLFAGPLIYLFVNQVLLAGATGASLGKHIMGLRVVKQSDGTLHGFGGAMLRWLLWIVDAIPFAIFLPLVGLITSLATTGHRRVGDMAASTLVVHKSQVGVPPIVPGLTTLATGAGAYPPAAMVPPSAMPTQPPYTPPYTQPGPPTAATPPPTGPVAAPPTGQTGVGAGFAPPASASTEPSFESPPAPPVSEPEPAEQAAPGVDAPTWDNQRNTYIQWDPALNEWMEWSAATHQWIPISQ